MVCDVYQELTGLQNGLYEMNLQAVFRPGETYTEENAELAKAFAYINSYESKVTSADVNSADEASDAFIEGTYPLTVYGLVTDGTMRIGITNKVRSVESCMLWAGGVSLTFRAKNADVLNAVIGQTLPNAQALLSAECGQPERAALQQAIDDAVEPDDAYAVLIGLKSAMENVEQGIAIYTRLGVAINTLADAIASSTTASAVTLANAQATLDAAKASFMAKAYDNEAAEQAINDLNAAAVAVKMGGENASEDNPVDYTSAIVNPNFDPAKGDKNEGRIDGWVTTAMNGYKEYTVSYNRAAFELNQKLSGLPKGKYKVTVHTYYRAGYWNEEEAYIANGTETHLTTLYAKTTEQEFSKPVLNLTEGATAEQLSPSNKFYTLTNGLYAPDGTTGTAEYFAAGAYLNELEFTVPADGEVTIGLSKKEVLANDYEVVGEWQLWYMGDPEQTDEPSDVSNLIVNNNFDPTKGDKNEGRIDGWVTTAMNGYKEYTVSYNRAGFELNQTLSGLPEGTYMVTVHTYYRAGYWNEEEAYIANGTETHLTTLYAKTTEQEFSKPVMNLTEGATAEQLSPSNKFYTLTNGLYAPDGTTGTAEYFAAGAYLNELEFTVPADGEVTIGLSKKEVLANDYEVVGEWQLWYMGDPEQTDEPSDVSNLIVNNNFDPTKGDKNEGRIDGWVTTAMNGYKEYTVSYNRAGFELNQTLSGLPEGTYMVTVHTYYRAGYWNEEEAYIANGTETHLTTLYAKTAAKEYSKPVMNLTEGATAEQLSPSNKFYTLSNGLYAPDGTTGTAEYFAAGAYLNKLPFYVGNDGTVTIGLSKKEVLANDYEVVGEWKLYYYGSGDKTAEFDDTGIENMEREAWSVKNTDAIFSISGARLNAPQRGINIIRTSDGRAIKVMVK